MVKQLTSKCLQSVSEEEHCNLQTVSVFVLLCLKVTRHIRKYEAKTVF